MTETGAGPRVRVLPLGMHGDELAELKAAERSAAGLPPARPTKKGGWRTRCRICSRLHKPGECRERDDEDVAAVQSGGTVGTEAGAPRTAAATKKKATTTTEGDPVMKAKKERNCGACGGPGHRKDSSECPENKGGARGKSAQGGGKGMKSAPTSLRTLIEKVVDQRLEQKIQELFK